MSKAIKVEDRVYEELDSIRGKGETFSQQIEALLLSRGKIFELIMVLEGGLKYREWQAERLQELQNHH